MDRLKVTTPPTPALDDYNESSMLNLFDPNNSDKNLFNMVDEEVIRLSGSEILLFKYIESEDIDDVYQESKRKLISTTPITIFGNYDPRPIEETLTQFGVEVQNDQVFVFNKTYIQRKIGRPIIPGDVLKPVFQNMKFEVYQVQEDSFQAYGVYHLLVHAKLLRDSLEIHNEHINLRDSQGGKL